MEITLKAYSTADLIYRSQRFGGTPAMRIVRLAASTDRKRHQHLCSPEEWQNRCWYSTTEAFIVFHLVEATLNNPSLENYLEHDICKVLSGDIGAEWGPDDSETLRQLTNYTDRLHLIDPDIPTWDAPSGEKIRALAKIYRESGRRRTKKTTK